MLPLPATGPSVGLVVNDLTVKLKAAETSTGAESPPSLLKCSHHVTLGPAIGSGSCAVVFSVRAVETLEDGATSSIEPELVAKVGMSGEDSCESSFEAKILSSIPRHINIVGFHGNFCTVERSEDLENLLGNFATRTLSRRQKVRSMTKKAMKKDDSSQLKEMQRAASELDETIQAVSDLDIRPLIYNFSLFEKCSLSLRDLLQFQTLTESELACAMSDVFRGLAFVHKHGVLHRDVTDGNMLLADGGLRIVLADFDLSVKTQGTGQVAWTCGTPGYIAPEVLKHGRGCTKSDIFGAGVVAFAAACGKHPFWREDIQDVQDTARATIHDEPDFWGGRVLRRSPKCLDFVDKLLRKEADERPTAKQALCNPWLLNGIASNLCAAVQRYHRTRSEREMEDQEEEEEPPKTQSFFRRTVQRLIASTKSSTKSGSDRDSSKSGKGSAQSSGSFWRRLRKRTADVKFSQIAPEPA